jgi:hypothetical protein
MSCKGDMAADGKNLVRNLKQDDTSDETIFHELSVLFVPQHHYANNLPKKVTISTAHNNTREAVTSGTKAAKSAINNHNSDMLRVHIRATVHGANRRRHTP